MNDIELAFQIDSTVGLIYESAYKARSVYKGSEVQYIRRALEALIINALDEFQEVIGSNLYDNIETLSKSNVLSSDIILLCHQVRQGCNQQLHFTPNANKSSSLMVDSTFDIFEKLLCSYHLSLGGKLVDYEKSGLKENALENALKNIYIEEELSSEQMLGVAVYWFEKHRGAREHGTCRVISVGTPFFLESAASLIRQQLRSNDDIFFDASFVLYLALLREPALIEAHYEEIYRLVKSKTDQGNYEFINALIDVTTYTEHLIPESAELNKLAFESGVFLSLQSLVSIYSYYNGFNAKFSDLVPSDTSLARAALLQAVNREDTDYCVLQVYAIDLYRGIAFEQDFKEAFSVLDKLALLNPVVAKETKSLLQGLFESGQVEIKNVKSVIPVVSNTLGRNDICLCGSGKKYKKCCLK